MIAHGKELRRWGAVLCWGPVKKTTMEDDGYDLTLGRGKVCCGLFIASATTDGLDSDVERVLEKGSLQGAETGSVVPVGRFHVDKERNHTPTLRQVQPKQTGTPRYPPLRRLRQKNNSSILIAPEK